MTYKTYRKHTAYDRDKEKKRTNFIYLNNSICKKGQTVIAGDSITEIFNMELFDEYIKKSGLNVYNRGISGDTSDRLCERFKETVLNLEPKNLVLLIGTNDLTLINDYKYVANNIERLIAETRQNVPNCKIILQLVFPVDSKNKKKNKVIIELNQILKKYKEKHNISIIDNDYLCDKDGSFNTKYTYDGLHPNAIGFHKISEKIIKELS